MKKFLIISGIVFIVVVAGLVIFTKMCMNYNNAGHGDKIEVIKASKVSNGKKALVVYQPSYITGATEKTAKEIAKGLNESGYEVTIGYPGAHMPQDVSEFYVVVFGSPVYASNSSKVLIDYLKGVKGFSNDKKITLFTTNGQDNNKGINNLENGLNGVKAYRKQKFLTSANYTSQAYDLGIAIGKEK